MYKNHIAAFTDLRRKAKDLLKPKYSILGIFKLIAKVISVEGSELLLFATSTLFHRYYNKNHFCVTHSVSWQVRLTLLSMTAVTLNICILSCLFMYRDGNLHKNLRYRIIINWQHIGGNYYRCKICRGQSSVQRYRSFCFQLFKHQFRNITTKCYVYVYKVS